MNLRTLYSNSTSISPYRSHYKMPGDPSYLEEIVPNLKSREICFVFSNQGITEPVNHLTFISFQNCKISEEEQPEETHYSFNYQDKRYWVLKHKLTNTVRVNCSCFSGDTKVILGNGEAKTLKELEGKKNFQVLSYDTNLKRFVKSQATSCSRIKENTPTIKVSFDNGASTICTPEHLFLTRNGEWIQAQNLSVGTSLRAFYGTKDQYNTLYQIKNGTKNKVDIVINKHSDYYVYIYLDPREKGLYEYNTMTFDYKPVYVGKGRADRYIQHLHTCVNEGFKEFLTELDREGINPLIIRTQAHYTETSALELEETLIEEIGTLLDNTGSLYNIRKNGNKMSKEGRKRPSQLMKVSNPMYNPEIVQKRLDTFSNCGRERVSNRMKINNPMWDKDIAKKASKTFMSRPDALDILTQNSHKRTPESFKKISDWRRQHRLEISKNKKLYWENKAKHDIVANIQTYDTFNKEAFRTQRYNKCKEKYPWFIEFIHEQEKSLFVNHKVVSIEPHNNEDVYCIEVVGTGNFVIDTSLSSDKIFSGVVVHNCSDFYYTFAWYNWQRQCLFGKKPLPYVRKTVSRPERNPEHLPGMCKHIYWNLIDLYSLEIMNQKM